MGIFKIYNSKLKPTDDKKHEIITFLHENLAQYGDPKKDIEKCLNFAIRDFVGALGGFVLELKEDNEIKGITIVNKTGMSGYIPENILVYIAVKGQERGKGYGKKILTKAIQLADGDIALHVEPDNPAKFLYEKIGFENKYLEMRYKNHN